MTRTNDAADRRVTDFGDVLPNAAGQTYDPSLRAFLAERGFLVDREAVADIPLDLDDEVPAEDPWAAVVDLLVTVAVVAVVFAGVFVLGNVIGLLGRTVAA